MSDQGTHFINNTIRALTKYFKVYHQKSMPYHPHDKWNSGSLQQDSREFPNQDLQCQ
jgi:hypothetical protein